jgi:hypothetical protein
VPVDEDPAGHEGHDLPEPNVIDALDELHAELSAIRIELVELKLLVRTRWGLSIGFFGFGLLLTVGALARGC